MNISLDTSTGEGSKASITNHLDSFLAQMEESDDHMAIFKTQTDEKVVKVKKARLKCPNSIALSESVRTILRAKSGAFTTVSIDVEGVCNAVLMRYLREYLAGMAKRLNR